MEKKSALLALALFWVSGYLALPVFSAPATRSEAQEIADIESPNLYQRLGLLKSATTAEIKSAYRKLATKYHPDKNPARFGDGLLMRKLNEAAEILSDELKRANYHRLDDRFDFSARTRSSPMPEARRTDFVHFEYANPNDPDDPNIVWQIEELRALKREHPELSTYLDGLIDKQLIPSLKRTKFWAHRKRQALWPSDYRMVQTLLTAESPVLLFDVAFNILVIPGWEKDWDMLETLIDRNIFAVNRGVGEFFYKAGWIHKQSVRLMHKLADQGHHHAVLRSLHLSDEWAKIPAAQDLMIRLVQESHSSSSMKDHLDATLASSSRSPWQDYFRTHKKCQKLPYLKVDFLVEVFRDEKYSIPAYKKPDTRHRDCSVPLLPDEILRLS